MTEQQAPRGRPSLDQAGDQHTTRGRGGFASANLNTIPEGTTRRTVSPSNDDKCELLTNYVRIIGMADRPINQYRVDFEPEVEAISLRKLLFRSVKMQVFQGTTIFDGVSEVRAGHRTPDDVTVKQAADPMQPDQIYTITFKHTGVVSSPHERLRIYNMHMKRFLEDLGFFKVTKQGIYVHHKLATPIDSAGTLLTVRGYNTAANLHRGNQLLMNFESVHKLMQRRNVLQIMEGIRKSGTNWQAEIVVQLKGKLVVTMYKKQTYRIEDVLFNENAESTFMRQGKEISYMDYMRNQHKVEVKTPKQPLLLAVNNTRPKFHGDQKDDGPIKLLPELCNMAGLTESQKADRQLKIQLIKASQIEPDKRVEHLKIFMEQFHGNSNIVNKLKDWGYSYDEDIVKLTGRVQAMTKIGVANSKPDMSQWEPADAMTADFERLVVRNEIRTKNKPVQLHIVYSPETERNYVNVSGHLKDGIGKVGCQLLAPVKYLTSGSNPSDFVQTMRSLDPAGAALVIVPNINKGRYDAIKKFASVDRGMITQVVTERLLMDDRKARGASVKIGIQLAAKLGAEPWHVDIPVKTVMVCGYDTYHDTANRGRSYGAFVASMNSSYSRWFSKADSHERLDELSSHMAENLTMALKVYRDRNDKFPDRIVIYRDGVGDGQLQHVHDVEVKEVRRAIKAAKAPDNIRLAFIVVNKRIGARFYRRERMGFKNPVPGTVVDDVITREERFDFYLVSQSTRNGTLTPTYYNILANDENCFPANIHQLLAYKLCFLYYNWTGTVRVPAPCQYAHKLAFLCGEHLHAVPHTNLDDRLHFL